MSARPPINALFVTWDGPRSPYLESLFLPILSGLRERGIAFHVLHFGWSDPAEIERLAASCARARIPYRYQPVWRRPVSLGSLATAVAGRRAVARAIADWAIDLVLPRSYMPALAAVAPARAAGCTVVLDADGLPNDERVEFAGAQPTSSSQRLLARIERWAVRAADAVLVRTTDAATVLAERAAPVESDRFTIVANARDENRFAPATSERRRAVRADLGIDPEAPLAIYVGSSLGGKYDGQGLVDFCGRLRALDDRARLLLVTPDVEAARSLIDSAGLADSCLVRTASAEVPALIGAADVGLSFIRATFSMRAASAIKTGEYLLCGIPVIATAGIGGIEHILGEETGLIIRDTSPDTLDRAARWTVDRAIPHADAMRAACRELGLRHFSLGNAIENYERALRRAHAGRR